MADDVRRLSEELARDPQSLVFVPLGETLRRQGQLDNALKIVLRGLERHPHLADAHDLLARVYADRGEAEKAFDEWDMVRRLAPGHAGAAKGMGFICFSQGRREDAVRYLEEALAGAPADDSIRAALAHVRAASDAPPETPARAPADAPAAALPVTAVAERPAIAVMPRSAPLDADDPRLLFATTLTEDDQTALLLDRDGFVLGGAYYTASGEDIAQEVGAELSGVSDEATRATRHLGIGAWRAIVFETEAATVAMAPSAQDGLVVLATGGSAPLGLTRRLLDRCVHKARAWLGEDA